MKQYTYIIIVITTFTGLRTVKIEPDSSGKNIQGFLTSKK